MIRWADGAEMRAYSLWLFENRLADQAIDEQTKECKLDPADLPSPDVLAAARVAPSGDLVVSWDGYPSSIYHSGWLRHVHQGNHSQAAGIPAVKTWTALSMPQLPTFDGPDVLADDEVLRDLLATIVSLGIARITGLGTGEEVVSEVGSRIGVLRDTSFGLTWGVTVDACPTSNANTSLPLPPHSDLPTRESPPGYQLLHCRKNDCVGGLSHMTDGYAVADHLLKEEPETYRILSTAKWVFFDRSPDFDHRWTAPIIDHGVDGAPLTFRTFHPVRGFPAMPDDEIASAYQALRRFSQLAGSDEYQLRSSLCAGELVIFDNRRILHGRGSIYETTGQRVLRGAYVDHDEVYSRLRVLTRRWQMEANQTGAIQSAANLEDSQSAANQEDSQPAANQEDSQPVANQLEES